MIGDYDNINSIEELTAQVWAFSTFVRTTMNKQVADSSYKVEYLSDELCEYLQSELDGMSEIDEEIISEYSDKVDKIFKNAIENILVGVIAEKAGIFVTEEVFQNLQLVISASDKLQSLPSDVEKYVNRVVAVIEGALYIWNNEIKGRAMYFNSYLNNRENYNSADDEAFLFIMEYNKFAIMDSTYASSIIDFFAWITGKDNWDAHTAELDSWAEYLFELEHYIGNIQYDNDDGTGDKNDEDIDSILGSQDVTLTKDVTINRDLFIKSGTLYLNGFTLTVKGDCYQAGGVIDVGGGRLNVEGDYRLQSRKVNAESGEIYYSYSTARIIMEEEKDYIYVGKNFVIDTNNSESNIFNAGILEIKGDFTQESKAPKTHVQGGGDWYYDVYSYRAKGSNKVVLSGNGKQIVSFEDPNESYFADLELQNTDVEFATKISGWILQRDTEFGNGLPNGMLGKFDLNGKALTVNGELDQTKGVLDVNGGKLLVTGDMKAKGELELNSGVVVIEGGLVQSDGNLYVRGGTLDIKGDYRVQNQLVNTESGETYYSYSTARIIMEEEKDYICVGGNFVIDTNNSESNIFNAGTLEIKGDFTQESKAPKTHVQGGGDWYYDVYSYRAKGSNKVVLSGNGKQIVSFEDPNESYFADLELQNTDVEFATKISGWILQRDTEFGNGLPNGMLGKFDLNGKALTVNGELDQTKGVLDVNGGKLLVTGDMKAKGELELNSGVVVIEGGLVQSDGNLYVRGGTLDIKGDYRVQNQLVNTESGETYYSYSTARIIMEEEKDYICVGGNFVIDTNNSKSNIFNVGILEIKGNFTQESRAPKTHVQGVGDRYYDESSFRAKGSNKVVLSGNGKQVVSFEDPNESYFADLELQNTDVEFATKISGWILQRDTEFGNGLPNGMLGTFDLNGNTLTVNGKLNQTNGTININQGLLNVSNEYLVNSNGILMMLNELDRVKVDGDFIMQSLISHNGKLIDGKMYIKGNFNQINGNSSNFEASIKHTVILDGTSVQHVTFESRVSAFNNLILTRDKDSYYKFSPDRCWKNITIEQKYRVNFKLYGNLLDEYVSYIDIQRGSTIDEPTSPIQEGYKFTGWYKDVKCTILWDFATDVVEGNMTLYAGWEKEISETESEPETGSQTESESESQTESETESQTETESESQTEPAKKVYTVLFELQGHGIALDEYSKYTEILEGDTIDEPTAPKTKGYKFTGWYKDAACTKPWVFDKDTVKSNIILYAGWRAVDDNPSNKENYSVTFDMRSHGLAPEPYKNILSGSTINPPTAPKAEGYTFTGWYKDANCTTLWSFVTDTVTSDITLYAGWKSVSDDPDIPNEPNNPDTPDKPDIPDNPDTPDEPDIPANPDNPSIGDVLPSDIPADGRIPDGLWTAAMKEYTYNGKPIKPDIHIYYGKTRLKEGWDYTVSYKNNTKAAAAADTKAPKITVKCKNGYTGTVSANFTIKRHTLTESNLIYTPTCQSGKTYTPVLVANGNLLKAKTDYTITYKKDGGTVKSPKKEGNYEIYIQGKNSCEGSFTVPYTVLDGKTTSIVKAKIKIGQMKYGDKPPKAVLTISGQTLIENTDYTVTYANTNAKGTATVICKGIGKYSGVIKKTFKVTAAKLPSNCITVNGDTTLKKGGAKPQVTVSVNGVKLIAGTDYTVTYKNNKKAGKTAIVTVKGKGNYSGSAKKTFVVENSKIQTKSD